MAKGNPFSSPKDEESTLPQQSPGTPAMVLQNPTCQGQWVLTTNLYTEQIRKDGLSWDGVVGGGGEGQGNLSLRER